MKRLEGGFENGYISSGNWVLFALRKAFGADFEQKKGEEEQTLVLDLYEVCVVKL